MWSAGVSRLTWWTMRDQPYPREPVPVRPLVPRPDGRTRRPKPALQAFRFPFVALQDRGRVLVWGRTPQSRAGSVSVQRSNGGGWRRVAVLRANGHGIFTARLALANPLRGSLRAVVGPGALNRARPFALRAPKDVRTQPFGDFGVDVDR